LNVPACESAVVTLLLSEKIWPSGRFLRVGQNLGRQFSTVSEKRQLGLRRSQLDARTPRACHMHAL